MKNIFILMLLLTSVHVMAQNKDSISIDDYYIDFSVPDLSALGMLGIENDEIVRPGNLKEFAAAITNYVDSDGSLKPAMALEWTFMKTFTKKDPIKWNKSFQPRNLALTFATTEEDSLGIRMGIGFKWVPIDKGDPLGDPKFYSKISTLAKTYYTNEAYQGVKEYNDFVLRILESNDSRNEGYQPELLAAILTVLDPRDELLKYRKGISNGDIENLEKTLDEALIKSLTQAGLQDSLSKEKKGFLLKKYQELVLSGFSSNQISFSDYISETIKKAKDDYRKQYWNAQSLALSAGWVGHSPTSTYNDFNNEKFSAFSSYSFPTIGGSSNNKLKGQLIAQLKYEMDLSGDSLDYNYFSIGAKHLFGNSNNRFSSEILYSNSQTTLIELDQQLPTKYLRYTIGAELKLTDGTWLEFSFGGQKFFEGQNEDNAILANFGFKHAIQNKRRYDTK